MTAQHYGRGKTVVDRQLGTNVTVWLTPDECRMLDAIARKRDLSRTAVVRELIHAMLETQRGN